MICEVNVKMIYAYRCPVCKKISNIWQKMDDNHRYECETCHAECARVWDSPAVKKNSGMDYSVTLGKPVGSHSEFETELEKTRIRAWGTKRLHKLGYTHKMHEEAAESYNNRLEESRKHVDREMEMAYESPRE
jgi:putative FmdB family regulatory protein